MSRAEQLRALAAQWNDAWNSRDAAKLSAFFADDGTYYEPSMSEPGPGKAAVAKSATSTWADWPSATFETVSVTVDGDRVALEWKSSATHTSGTDVNLEGVDILEFSGEKIAIARVYYDRHSRYQAIEK